MKAAQKKKITEAEKSMSELNPWPAYIQVNYGVQNRVKEREYQIDV